MNAVFCCPQCNTPLAGTDLSNPAAVSDAQLLAFLGDQAHEPAEPLKVWLEPGSEARRLHLAYGDGLAPESHRLDRLEVRASPDPTQPWANWYPLNGPPTLTAGDAVMEDTFAVEPAQFYPVQELP